MTSQLINDAQAINESLEKKESQLSEVINAANLDPNLLGTVSKKLDDVLDAKNGAIKDLQYELARVTKAHNDVIRVYESKLTEFGIPVEELGFRPSSERCWTALGRGKSMLCGKEIC